MKTFATPTPTRGTGRIPRRHPARRLTGPIPALQRADIRRILGGPGTGAGREAAKSQGAESAEERLKNTATTSGAKIDITFDPSKSSKAKACDQIVHVQFGQEHADGKVIQPGTYYAGRKYVDPVTTKSGTYLDHLASETTPDYQQGTGVGKKNGGTVNATMSDTPGTGGGDKGFHSPANPTGWKSFVVQFATYAWCMKGTDCPSWYEGLTWKYEKTSTDHKDGKPGKSTITDSDAAGPSADHLEASKKFNSAKGYTPCK